MRQSGWWGVRVKGVTWDTELEENRRGPDP